MNRQQRIDLNFLLLILVSCLLAYWPLTFGIFSLKNEALNYFLPVRFQISEAISNGHWPFWSPFLNFGYPLHGDMQSGVWNPFVQLISLFGPYSLRTLQLETLLYVFLSGVGMFYLLKHLFANRTISLFGSVAYMLCGYNSDSGQFLNWISSASFIPFVFLFYYRTLQEASYKAAAYCSFFLYLLFVTAYPADFILMCYVMLGMLIWKLVSKQTKTTSISQYIKIHSLLLILFTMLSLPAIISYFEFLKLSERGSGASFHDAMSNPLHPKLLFSYIAPLGVWRAPNVSITDPLERNSYIGIITFAFLLLSLLIKSQQRIINFSKVSFVIFLIFSFGTFGGLRVIAYYILPLLDTFRHPANAKIFTTFFACIISTSTLQMLVADKVEMKSIKTLGILFSLLISILIIWSFTFSFTIDEIQLSLFDFNSVESIKHKLTNLNFSDLVLINIIIQVPFIVILSLFLIKKIKIPVLVLASIVNSITHTMLFQPFTVVKKDSVSSIQAYLDKVQVNGYPIPDLTSTIKENSKEGNTYFDEIGVLNLYNKKIGRVDYRITPSNLLTQNEFWLNENVKNHFLDYPVFYRADSAIFPGSFQIDSSIHKKYYTLLQNQSTINLINHSSRSTSPYQAHFEYFSPNIWKLSVQSGAPGYFCLFQNYYPRWQLFVNGERKEIDLCNLSFMGFYLPAGTNKLEFKYQDSDLRFSFIISLVSLTLILLFPFFQNFKKD